jgi:hypothetical protein
LPDESQDTINKLNDLPDYPAGSLQSLLTPILVPIVLLLSIKMMAAYAIPPRIDQPDSPPRWTQSAQSKPIGHLRPSSFILHPSSFSRSLPP